MNVSPRYDRPNISLIEPNLPGYGVDLFIGGMEGAGTKVVVPRVGEPFDPDALRLSV